MEHFRLYLLVGLGALCLALTACGGSGEGDSTRASTSPAPAPQVTLTAEDKKVWAPLPPDRSAIPVLLYHGIGAPSDFSNSADAAYGVDPADVAKQMTLIHHAGFRTIDLPTFVRFVQGKPVDLPPRPLLLTFDDGRLDSWTGSDSILRKLGFNAVMFVDVGRVSDGNPEYMTWDELRTAEQSGRWNLQVHSGHGHIYVRYGPGPEDTGPAYAYRRPGESFAEWRDWVFSDINWAEKELSSHTQGYRPLAFAPPYGAYGQEGTNDPRIPKTLLGWLKQRFDVIFTQDRNAFAKPGANQPLGRFEVDRSTTGGALHDELVNGG
jgi:hypothetical protein